ncbi:hypothetical protein M0638_27105 [Roseomonas sp. NAR14]|uniref:Uncharacterized protein n=1 Tax=Roseomonas acroporae TaxID=2937791 RepID=A0A9X1YF88_9PROT|nr:hypothetical protein [Roseomonas acroporae]MCK8788030.1 hypothetical protein [Roseomonas acroporae]
MAAFACLAGHAIVLVGRWSRDAAPAWRRPLMAAGMLAAAAGMAGFLMQPWDLQKRRLALTTPEALFDLEAYRWILANTAPVDLFVTGLADPADPGSATVDPGTAVVMAAGRRLVAAPAVFSNPYVDWEARQARRLAYLESLDGTGDPARLCELAAEAGGGAAAYLLLPAGHAAGTDRVTPVLRTAGTILYRVAPCPAASRASPAETPAG